MLSGAWEPRDEPIACVVDGERNLADARDNEFGKRFYRIRAEYEY